MKKYKSILMLGLVGLLFFGSPYFVQAEGDSQVSVRTSSGVTFIKGDEEEEKPGGGGVTPEPGGGSGTGTGTTGGIGGKIPLLPQTGEARATLLGFSGAAIVASIVFIIWRRKKTAEQNQ